VPVTKARGRADFDGRAGYITVHPSYLLRIPDADAKAEAYKDFIRDLKRIHHLSTEAPA
jgi:DNA polymerase